MTPAELEIIKEGTMEHSSKQSGNRMVEVVIVKKKLTNANERTIEETDKKG